MLLQPLIFLIWLITFSHEVTDKDEIISLSADFLALERNPVKVNYFTCWTNKDTLKLANTISRKYPYKISNSPNLVRELSPADHQFFVIDINCASAIDTLMQAEELKLFQEPFQWIIFGNLPMLANLSLGVDSKVFVAEKVNDDNYEIKSLYKYSIKTTNVVENNIAIWRKNAGFLHFNTLSTPQNRTNLNGTRITISYVITNLDSLNHLWDYRYKQIDSISKLNYILAHYLADIINASTEFLVQRSWGYKNVTTGLYSGMVGDLQLGKAELGGTPLFFTIDRMDVVDYIAPTTRTFIMFIFRAPPLSYVTNIYTLPFNTTVWHCCVVMIAVSCIAIYVIVIWEWKEVEFREKIQHKHDSLKPNIFEVIMMGIGAISQQGYSSEPKSISGRIATITIFTVLMFLSTCFSASIFALLQSTSDSVRTLADLLKYRIELGVEDIVYAHYYFETAQEPVKKAIYEQKVAPRGQKPHFMGVEEGIRRVRTEFFAFHVEQSTGYKAIHDTFQENEKCALKEIDYINVIEPMLSVRKKSTYKEIMKVGMRKIHEFGIQQRELHRIYTRKPSCQTRPSNFSSVGMIDCYAAFLVFGTGVALSVVLLLMEIIMHRKLHNQVRNEENNGTFSMKFLD